MIDREHDLPIAKQAAALRISRGSVYYLPRPVPEADLAIMRRLDQLHLEFPFAGSRMLRGLLAAEGCKTGRRHVKTLMKRMGIEALYRRPRTTKPEPGHKIHPYLLRGMEITRPNHVWAMDITYIPMASGFVYLAVVLDWATRRVLSWRLSITMEAAFCVETLEDALARHSRPEIFNTDQGSQFTGAAFTGLLASNGIAISMDGKGAWRDNVFVERLWRSVKYEEVYLRAYETVGCARQAPIENGGASVRKRLVVVPRAHCSRSCRDRSEYRISIVAYSLALACARPRVPVDGRPYIADLTAAGARQLWRGPKLILI
jgi:putative transposase